jgi:Glycosyl hydrolase catalytic core
MGAPSAIRRAPVALVAVLVGALSLAGGAHAQALPGVASGVYAQRGDGRRLAAVGARWTYDWSTTSRLHGTRVEFVPMMWGGASVTDQAIAQLTADRRTGRAKRLLGFNEPDNGGQANMSPAQAIALWPRLQSTGLQLGSPAVSSPSTPSQSDPSKSWLDDFMGQARAKGLRVDFIALHFYGDYTDPATVGGIERDLRRVHDRWHLPIWVTEMGALPTWTWNATAPHAPPTPALARAHLRRMTAMLDRLPFVRRYAWFMDRCSGDCASTSLYGPQGRPTALGRLLARLAR